MVTSFLTAILLLLWCTSTNSLDVKVQIHIEISGEVSTEDLCMNHMGHATCWQKPVKGIIKKENKAGGK